MDHYPCDCVNTAPCRKPKSYKLKFLNGVASPVLTGPVLTGENGRTGIKASGGSESIIVALVDSETDQLITDEPAASKRVRIVLLPEDFCSAVWTRSKFKTSIITEHGNKKNILLGDIFVNLKHGRGTIGEIWIKHDKNHHKKVQFRLGAMIDDCSYEIKEAITEPFQVNDYRNKLTSKDGSVTPKDKVSKLKKIGKTICKRLEDENIKTVADFLKRFNLDPSGLKEIYGSDGKKFEETVRHAKTSSISDKKCSDCVSVGSSTTQERGNKLLVEHESRAEVDIDSYEPSPSSNNTMPMTLDQDSLTFQDYYESTNIWSWELEVDPYTLIVEELGLQEKLNQVQRDMA